MKLRTGDFVVIALVIATAAAIWAYPFFNGGNTELKVEISQNGELVKSVPLDGRYERIVLSGCTVEISDGGARMLESDCDDRVCVRTGEIHGHGQSVICVPNRVTVDISGESGIDAVAG